MKYFFLFTIFFFNSCKVEEKEIRVGFIDTEFCTSKLTKYHFTKINRQYDASKGEFTKHNNQRCMSNLEIPNREFHGHFVLNTFLKHFKSKKLLQIFPINVFSKTGNQNIEYWKNAIDFSNKNKIDIIITASAFLSQKKLIKDFKSEALLLASSGTNLGGKKNKVFLWPQSINNPNHFLFGHYYKSKFGKNLFDKSLLHQKRISAYVPIDFDSKYKELGGSSYAVAVYSAKLLSELKYECLKDTNCIKREIKAISKQVSVKKDNVSINLFSL